MTNSKKTLPSRSLDLAQKLWRELGASIHYNSKSLLRYLKKNIIGLTLIFLVTIIFFSPLILHLNTYMEMGDKMFNAWTLGRDQACILGQNCPNYTDGNIFYPNSDSMLYSETQLSTGLLTLPLQIFTDNPITITNICMILSYLFSGWFMYLLAKRLSGGREVVSIIAGLIFMLAPIRLGSGAPTHLQNLSILYLPLITLAAVKYLDTKRRLFLGIFFASLVLLFYASWYQMAFVAIAVGLFLLIGFVIRYIKGRDLIALTAVFAIAVACTLPLATRYISFSKENNASFSVSNQVQFSTSVSDYTTPYSGTIAGTIYQQFNPGAHAFNPDSTSYIGLTLTLAALIVVGVASFRLIKHKKLRADSSHKLVIIMAVIALIAFLLSLGPLIKLGADYTYTLGGLDAKVVVPGPWLVISKLLPQINFIRAIGRIAIILLFVICCILALSPMIFKSAGMKHRTMKVLLVILMTGVALEIMPTSIYALYESPYSYHSKVPAIYTHIKNDPQIDSFIILRSKPSYIMSDGGTAEVKFEDVLWAGYHNKNIFNGLSGYSPPNYDAQYADFVDFKQDDVQKLKSLGIHYVVVDNKMTDSASQLAISARDILQKPLYSDDRYSLYQLN